MGSEWIEYLLEDLADDITVGHVGSMASEYVEDGIPFLRSLNIQPHRVVMDDIRYIRPDFHKRLRKSSLRPGDVVIVRTGKPGTCAVIPEWLPDANCSDVVIVRCGPKLDNRFLSYFVNSVAAGHIAAHTVGAVQQHFNVGSARKICIPLPSRAEQIEITETLGALDDKIALLRETNATLEAIAQAIFKSWFVDFDPARAKAEGRDPEGVPPDVAYLFPSEFDESVLEAIPIGWVQSTLEAVSDLNPESWTAKVRPKTVLYVDLANAKDNRIDSLIAYRFEDAPSRARRVLRAGDTVVGTVRPGNRSFAFIQEPAPGLTGSTGFAVLRPKKLTFSEFVFLAATRRESIETLAHHADGGAYPAVRPELVQNLAVALPPEPLVDAFHEIVSPLLKMVELNERAARLLSELRDTLLPRLICGKLRVQPIENPELVP